MPCSSWSISRIRPGSLWPWPAFTFFSAGRTRARATKPEAARRVDLVHLALAIGFITVAIPIRLDAHWITIGWFVEAAVLLWVADRFIRNC